MNGTCSYCQHEGTTVPASLQPGSDRRQCADRAACMARLDQINRASRKDR